MPRSVPAILKDAAPFLARAEEVAKADPTISYWCKYYAAQIGIEKSAGDAEAQSFLMQLMDELERLKDSMSEQDAVKSETVAYAYIENFALRIFLGADNQDRQGQASRATAQAFAAASKFLEVLRVFGPLEAETQTKVRYAKWKAAQISKALRDGDQPRPGPAENTVEEQEEEQVLSQLVPNAPTSTNRQTSESIDLSASDHNGLSSSTMPRNAPDSGLEQSAPSDVEAEDVATATGSFLPSIPSVQTGNLTSSSPSAPPAPSAQSESSAREAPSSATSTKHVTAFAPTTGTVLAPATSERVTTHSTNLHIDPDACPLSIQEIARVQKMSRWACSALDYEDVETARAQLREALEILDTAIASKAA